MRATDSATVRCLIAELEKVRFRPSMYIGCADDVDRLNIYLSGFLSACIGLGISYGKDINLQVIHSAGWNYPPDGVARVMRDRGMTDSAIVPALIDLEILKWKKLLDTTE
jgi:hypothetical protein